MFLLRFFCVYVILCLRWAYMFFHGVTVVLLYLYVYSTYFQILQDVCLHNTGVYKLKGFIRPLMRLLMSL